MIKRFIGFGMWLIVGAIAGMVFFVLFMPLSMSITCNLQNSETYSCQTVDKVFGKYSLIEKNYTNVSKVQFDSSCSSKKSCGWRMDFVLSSGEVTSPRFYHSNEENIPSIVADINRQIDAKQPEIKHEGRLFSPYFSVGMSILMVGIFVYLAFARLFGQ